ncbi:MAG: hypothetical protein AAGI08_08970, partial [Bacteroidota bacterium]
MPFRYTPLLVLSLFSLPVLTAAQSAEKPALDATALAPYTTYAQIEGHAFTGDGGAFLEHEANENTFVLLGEFHGSRVISEFTDAFVRLYDEAGAAFFVLEVGPISAQVLAERASGREGAIEAVRRMNAAYSVEFDDGDQLPPIPFFSYRSDAQFLETALERDWTLVGIDQEFLYGGLMLLDYAWEHVPETEQARIEPAYRQARDSLAYYIAADVDGTHRDNPDLDRLAIEFLRSDAIAHFFELAGEVAPRAAEVEEHVRRSMTIYEAYAQRRYWDSNVLRIDHLIGAFHQGLTSAGFDPQTDRALVKIGGNHAMKGPNSLHQYDVGNAAYEKARAEGVSSLHLTFVRRFAPTDS